MFNVHWYALGCLGGLIFDAATDLSLEDEDRLTELHKTSGWGAISMEFEVIEAAIYDGAKDAHGFVIGEGWIPLGYLTVKKGSAKIL